MTLSYAITVCDEYVEIQRLVEFLLKYKRPQDKITVLLDETKQCKAVEDYLRTHSVEEEFSWFSGKFTGHFADWKNLMNSYCTGDYIFNIDADEYPHEDLIQDLPGILADNPTVEAFVVPRVNTVEGLTQEHITKWGWHVNENGWVNFPDYQWRIYKNIPYIKWKNKVHEVLEGYKVMAQIPGYESLSLYHPKTIERQEKQNNYYNKL